jgi:uncharacterized protein (TIGR00369 family)
MPTLPDDLVAWLNANPEGWNAAMGLRFLHATADEVAVEWDVEPRHLQAYGIVHGGVYAGVIETLASLGAAISAMQSGQSVVGLENSTSFLHAVRGGKLRAVARPIARGRRTQVWEGTVSDEAGRAVATGRVRLLCLEPGAEVAGERVKVREP